MATLYFFHRQGHEVYLGFFRLVDYDLSFRATHLGLLLGLTAALMWFLASVYAFVYMDHERSQSRFFAFLMASLAGCLGVFLAGDYFTLFLFFELMTFAAYPLVIHEEDENALQAGDTYLYLGVAGGLVLLFGIVMLVWLTGTAEIVPALHMLNTTPTALYLIIGTFIFGFGVKAGLVPLHIWLPQAHPVAPSPASALLSGIMIKTGAYGIIRILTVTLRSPDPGASHHITSNVGYVMIWLALLTMIGGAIMALMQDSIKKILAYSSVSQMGYIMLGVGVTALLVSEGGLGYAGAVYHIINHAVFKSGLFLMIGTVYLATHSLSLSRLGGLYRHMPYTALATLVASFAVIGVPGFSGFASKTLLHEAILEAAHFTHDWWLLVAEKLFMVGSALTAAYFIKLYTGVFLGRFKGDRLPEVKENKTIVVILLVFALLIVVVGVGAEPVLFKVIKPTAAGSLVDTPALYDQLHHAHLWDPHAYKGIAIPAMLGVLVFFLARKLRFFSWDYPWWMSVELLVYRPLARGFMYLCCQYVTQVEGGICDLYDRSGTVSGRLLKQAKRLDTSIDDGYEAIGRTASDLVVKQAKRLDTGIDDGYEAIGRTASDLVQDVRGSEADAVMPTTVRWSPQNITLGSLVVALCLLLVLIILYYFGGNVL
jgi:formate hydrogenlyase subunit 3/multisubunit Na+/H+ antiporter MnhD subunit